MRKINIKGPEPYNIPVIIQPEKQQFLISFRLRLRTLKETYYNAIYDQRFASKKEEEKNTCTGNILLRLPNRSRCSKAT
jgi:hypothetical protein